MKRDVLIYFDLITSLKTTREVDDLSLEIDTLASELFGSEKMSLEKALDSISSDSAKKIKEIFSNNKFDIEDKKIVSDFLDTLKDLLKKFKVIKLILAFDPTLKTIEKIHEFISENIGIGYILDIEIDESILAGAAVMFNGKYKDFTLKKSLDEVFANKSLKILE
ncbi:MAG: hypothetical protein HYW62_01910 [Candidatus Levybacteria bacterium]|nr:hypothetical protein [Candidatus Levybacteria bacterium]